MANRLTSSLFHQCLRESSLICIKNNDSNLVKLDIDSRALLGVLSPRCLLC